MAAHDFLLEKRLHHLNRPLHRCFTDAVFALQHTLSRYKRLFPEYTDHTEQLNADEIYVLLMSGYLHDVGMGISQSDYDAFKHEFGADEWFCRASKGYKR